MRLAGSLLLRVGASLASLMALLVGGVLGAWALAHTEWLGEQALPRLPGVKVVAPRGALLGDFQADRIEIGLPRGGSLVLVSPSWKRLRLLPDFAAPWWVGVAVDQVAVQRAIWRWVPGPATQPSPPLSDLRLPVGLTVDHLQVGEVLGLTGAQPLRDLQAFARIGPLRHEVRVKSLSWSGWRLTGVAGVGAPAPMPVELDLRLKSSGLDAGQGEVNLKARGPLAQLAVEARALWRPQIGEAQTVEAQAVLDVLAPWPVRQARLRAKELDLAVFSPAWPRTRLGGSLEVSPQGASALLGKVDLGNPLAAPWDAGRLPVRALRGTLTLARGQVIKGLADVLQGGRVDLQAVVPGEAVSAGGKEGSAGRLWLKGPWGGGSPLALQLDELAPRGLHGSAPALRLNGEVTLTPSAWQVRDGRLDLSRWQAELSARLQGRITGGEARLERNPVALKLSSRLSAEDGAIGEWSIREWVLSSGEAEARLEPAWLRWGHPGVAWSTGGTLNVKRFDPRVWLPWPASMSGHNSLSGRARFEFDSRWFGELDWAMSDSQLAGLPLVAGVRWRSARAQPMAIQLQAEIAGNRLQLDGNGPPVDGVGARALEASWALNLDAPRLAALAPLAPLLGLQQLGGAVQASGRAQGWWPGAGPSSALRSLPGPFSGRLSAQGVTWRSASGSPGSVASAQGEWLLDLRAADAPLRLQLTAREAAASRVRVDLAELSVDGTVLSHRLRLQAGGAWVTQSGDAPDAGAASTEPLRLDVALDGSWSASSDGQGRWRGRLTEASLLAVGPVERPPLLRIQPVDMLLERSAQASSVTVQATRLVLLGADLELERFRWSRSAQLPSADAVDVLARIQPLSLAPLLARWQPHAGWGGDLKVGGRVRLLHSADHPWEVDVELARQSGDLSLTESAVEGGGAQRLGLRDASLSLRSRDGVWVAQQKLDGRVFGQLTGRQQVQSASAASLPGPGAALQGELSLQVSNLRPLATWAPPGWRLNGQLQASVQVDGTLGEPRLTGAAQGRQLGLSQALLGIHVTDGELDMTLEGDRVRLKRLQARGGPQGGTLGVEGELLLNDPASLTLDARADRFVALQRVDRRVVVSGALQATVNEQAARVRGGLRVDEGLIDISRSAAPTLGSDVTVLRRNARGVKVAEQASDAAGASASLRRPIAGRVNGASETEVDIQVGVDLGERLRLKGHGLDGFLVGKLNLTTPSNRPAVHGAIEVDKGTFAAYGQKLIIQRSTVTFTGLIDNPRLDILAMRPQSPAAQDSDVKVGVRITGTAQDPRVRLYSEPALSETEQLSWLVLGRGPTGLGGADIGLLQSAAVALLSGEDSRGPSDQLIGLLGLDELSVRQTDGAVRDTVVNVGKQVSRLWYVGYERNLNATGGNWQLIYTLARRFRLRAQAGEDNAVDLIWQWRWD